MASVDEERSVLEDDALLQDGSSEPYTGDGSVDIKGRPVLKNATGKWKACPFILGAGGCERLAFYGISSNLVTYLTSKLHEGNASAARNVTTWEGTCYFIPLIGGVLADAYWGRYWTMTVFFAFYLIGMCTLTLCALIPALQPAECVDSVCPSATAAQYTVFFIGLYLVALGTGGIKPCIWPFGADQYDDTDRMEKGKKGSFFNWFYFSNNIGALISSSLVVLVQEDIGWGLGYGIPTLVLGIGIAIFFLGTPFYRLHRPGGSPLTRICQVFVASFHKWNLEVPEDSSILYETQDMSSTIKGSRKLEHSEELKCLDKAAVVSDAEIKRVDFSNPWRLCTVTQVEELKILVRMFPIWASGIIFSAVYAQMSSLFVEQGKMMDRSVGSFSIPAASLSSFNIISVIIWVPIYDMSFAWQQAAIVEIERLQIAREMGLVDEDVAVPLSIFWQVPQYFLLGAAEVFTFIGQHEFFYEQAPDAMRSLCSALSLLTNSLGNYLSSLILTIVTYFTTKGGNVGWIPDNLNEGHLDYFFWLLAGLSFLNLLVYIVFARKVQTEEGFLRLHKEHLK
uniref:Major facilitator superfamily (MFS) profile domain-containing protein n=1 Tax=Fagus sylvatica TaxID=28930 RepID=A0A2N9HSD3_FAGSY